MLHVAVFGSGRGSNFQAILDAMQRGDLPKVTIGVVVSNNSGAGILTVARAHDIPAVHLSHSQFARESDFVDAVLHLLRRHGINFVALAGYMKKLHPRIVAEYAGRIINIHPALLPKYGGKGMYGIHVHEAVVANGDTVSGASVHIVDEEFDRGPVVLQKEVALHPGDTPATVAERVLAVEHEIYPQALRLFSDGRVTVKRNAVVVHS
jgi:phosphoribosylglycinamide formyltransferase-1